MEFFWTCFVTWRLITCSRPLLFFIILFINVITLSIEVNFLKLFNNRLSECLIFKKFPACNGYFGLFPKIKKGSGTSFWCIFSAWFLHENVPYLILYQLTTFNVIPFFLLTKFVRGKLNNKICFIKFLCGQLMAL